MKYFRLGSYINIALIFKLLNPHNLLWTQFSRYILQRLITQKLAV